MGILDNKLLITSGQGMLFLYDLDSNNFDVVFETPNPNEYFMGVSRYKDRIFVSSNLIIYELKITDKMWECVNSLSFFPIENRGYNPKIQHIKVIGDKIFAPARAANGIFVIALDSVFSLLVDITIKPTLGVTDYDNIVGIHLHNGLFYLCFNAVADNKGKGGIVILDHNLALLKQDYFGWDCYSYTIVDNKSYFLCNKNDDQLSGLICNNKLEISYGDLYCMDYSINDDLIIIVGGGLNVNNTNTSGGVVLKFDRNFKAISEPVLLKGGGQFMGCMLMKNDLTNNLYEKDINNVDFSPYTDGRVRVRDLTKFDTKMVKR
jgi:hypothetical protein